MPTMELIRILPFSAAASGIEARSLCRLSWSDDTAGGRTRLGKAAWIWLRSYAVAAHHMLDRADQPLPGKWASERRTIRPTASSRLVLLCRVLGVGSLVAVLGCAQIDHRNAIGAPNLKVGEAWTYSVVEVDLRDSERKRREYSVTREVAKVTSSEVWVHDQQAVFAGRPVLRKFDNQSNPIEHPLPDNSKIVRFEPHLPRFVFPLAPNQTWRRNFTVTKLESRELGDLGQSEGKVIGWEEISVVVGHFKALKIETLTPYYAGKRTRIIFADPKLHGGAQEQFWYVPELKNVIKYVRKDYVGGDQVHLTESELIDYKLEDRAFAR
jgi:hypothetical protein